MQSTRAQDFGVIGTYIQHVEMILSKIINTFNGPLQGERACIKDLEYILLEILD